MRKQQVDWERECEFWKEKIYKSIKPSPGEEEALELLDILQSGEAAFFCESPHAASLESAADMVRQAARKMAPEPGRPPFWTGWSRRGSSALMSRENPGVF